MGAACEKQRREGEVTSLKKAREAGDLEGFIQEHESDAPGDQERLERIIRRAAETPKAVRRASRRGSRQSRFRQTETGRRLLPPYACEFHDPSATRSCRSRQAAAPVLWPARHAATW